jgi:hypothetical protein
VNPSNRKKTKTNFKIMSQSDVPQGRNGRHKSIVTRILNDLNFLQIGFALKIPLNKLTDKKANVRSALNRATRKGGRHIATAADDQYLYIWNEKCEKDL